MRTIQYKTCWDNESVANLEDVTTAMRITFNIIDRMKQTRYQSLILVCMGGASSLLSRRLYSASWLSRLNDAFGNLNDDENIDRNR